MKYFVLTPGEWKKRKVNYMVMSVPYPRSPRFPVLRKKHDGRGRHMLYHSHAVPALHMTYTVSCYDYFGRSRRVSWRNWVPQSQIHTDLGYMGYLPKVHKASSYSTTYIVSYAQLNFMIPCPQSRLPLCHYFCHLATFYTL